MQYGNLPLFIPILAAVYLFTIYGVLKLAELQKSLSLFRQERLKKPATNYLS